MKALDTQNKALTDLLTRLYTTKSKGIVSKKIMLIVMAFDHAIEALNEKRQSLKAELGRKNKAGALLKDQNGEIVVPKEKEEEFQSRMEAYLLETFETPKLEEAELSVLGDISGHEMRMLVDAGLVNL